MKIKINQEFKDKNLNFISSLRKSNTYNYLPCNEGLTKEGRRINLGFSCLALKSIYILNESEKLQLEDKLNWVENINSYQLHSNNQYPKGSFIDEDYLQLVSKFNYYKESKRLLKKILNKNYKKKKIEIDEFIRAETKQAISTLYQVGSKNNINYENDLISNNKIYDYLDSLNWRNPWSAGAQFSGLCVFLKSQKLHDNSYAHSEKLLNNFAQEILNMETGCYFKGERPSNSELINGTMKVLTGLDWLETPVHSPKQLIDTCLNIQPLGYGCDIVDIIYILYMCSRETSYKKKEVIEYLENIEFIIGRHYFFETGGFSYYENKSQLYYYGLNITKGKNVPDLHGTMLLIWACSMINFIKQKDDIKLNLIKP